MAKQTPPADTSTSGIVTSDAARKRGLLSFLPHDKRGLIGGAVVALVIVGAGAYVLLHNTAPTPGSATKSSNADESKSAATETPFNTAQDLVATGKYDQAQAVLDDALASAHNDTQKGAVYEQKSSAANNGEDFQKALDYAQQAEKLHPTQTSAYLVAIAAESLGDKPMAISYYHKALDRLSADQKKRSPDLADSYNAAIKELSQ